MATNYIYLMIRNNFFFILSHAPHFSHTIFIFQKKKRHPPKKKINHTSSPYIFFFIPPFSLSLSINNYY
ncbi:hypothetical protein BDC45DRAFT_500251 [Circinella umbellata]|nr:hypothetical protein BDC45DRAFT_500251 [Circinella umbellata]